MRDGKGDSKLNAISSIYIFSRSVITIANDSNYCPFDWIYKKSILPL
jgi:hypothetical protein